jgi:hypothetical protein
MSDVEKARINISDLHARDIFIALDGGQITAEPRAQRRLKGHPSIFVERATLKDQLASRLKAAIFSNTSIALVLRGPRGCGKSTIAEDVCHQVAIKVHPVVASTEPELRWVGCDDLVFVDGFMEDKLRDEAEAWLHTVPARFFVITTRVREATSAIRSVVEKRGTLVEEFEIGGFERKEFLDAVFACNAAPGCASIELSSDQLDYLFTRTGGLPLAVQLIFNLFGSPTANPGALIFLPALHPDEVLTELVKSWRQKVVERDDDLRLTLFSLANVPLLGMSADAIAYVLDWSIERTLANVRKLWGQGFISQVSLDDSALRTHDAITHAFIASKEEVALAKSLRKRYCGYCDSHATSKSAISMADSLMRASEYLFERVESDDFEAGGVQAFLVILELERLQRNIVRGQNHSEWQARKFASWLGRYLEKNSGTLKCNEVIAMGGLALSLPIGEPSLAEAFTPLWETGKEKDPTKVPTAMMASIRHWRIQIELDRKPFLKRLEAALERQPWASFGTCHDLVAAGFAAAYAMMDEHSLGAANLAGYRIRGRGISHREGFSVLLLSLEAKGDREKASRFLQYNGHFCRDIDPITGAYLNSRGVHCPSQHYGGAIQENLNRQALFALWSGNTKYYEFVKRMVEIAHRRSDSPPIFEISRPDLHKVSRTFATS